jgi:hypothetical protein
MPSGVQFNAKFEVTAGSGPYEGITFWDDWSNNFVLFAVTPSGQAGIFRHKQGAWSTLVDWRTIQAIHRGLGAINSLSINLDRQSGALGRTFLINGIPMGSPCNDSWRSAIGSEPTLPSRGLFVGLVAGSFSGATHVTVVRASMYDGTNNRPVPMCPTSAKPSPTPGQ